MKSTRILLGDDHSLILDGVRRLLADDYEVVGSSDNGQALVETAARLQPDMVILDISMPVLNGIDAARQIKKNLPGCKLIFLSMHSSALYLRRAFEAGGSGYVLKSDASAELLTAIDVVLREGTFVSSGFAPDVIESVRSRSTGSSRLGIDLTGRQRQILQLIAEGKQNKEIADLLRVSVKTVEFHRSRLMAKLGARTVAELTRFAIEEGLVGI